MILTPAVAGLRAHHGILKTIAKRIAKATLGTPHPDAIVEVEDFPPVRTFHTFASPALLQNRQRQLTAITEPVRPRPEVIPPLAGPTRRCPRRCGPRRVGGRRDARPATRSERLHRGACRDVGRQPVR